jgi:hypothetical protein
MYAKYDEEVIATVRRPIQCEGIERGPKRVAEVAVSGSMNPQFDLGSFLGAVAPPILGALGI